VQIEALERNASPSDLETLLIGGSGVVAMSTEPAVEVRRVLDDRAVSWRSPTTIPCRSGAKKEGG